MSLAATVLEFRLVDALIGQQRASVLRLARACSAAFGDREPQAAGGCGDTKVTPILHEPCSGVRTCKGRDLCMARGAVSGVLEHARHAALQGLHCLRTPGEHW